MTTLISIITTHLPVTTFDKGMSCHLTRIELFYFDDNFRRIAQCVLAFTVGGSEKGG